MSKSNDSITWYGDYLGLEITCKVCGRPAEEYGPGGGSWVWFRQGADGEYYVPEWAELLDSEENMAEVLDWVRDTGVDFFDRPKNAICPSCGKKEKE